MSTLTFAEKLSFVAILISVASFFVAARSAFLDRTRLKVSSVFHESDEWGPAQIVVTIINRGRRPAILRLFGGTDANGIGSGLFFDHEKGGLRLAENERHERIVKRDDTVTFDPNDADLLYETLWVEDSLGVRHDVPNSREYIKKLWAD